MTLWKDIMKRVVRLMAVNNVIKRA